ncbi:TdeIII family type II restriction endonuclease [Nitrosophilus alvini]|uniref:TdeIII family type II restriction endonuclease n=1 Tax=Nitrosophilus alvini TaxID=2714855 RepID=UPI00190C3FFA|nr:TdeIII family type II restriction endonuclease [Nitrosophilus alvini]
MSLTQEQVYKIGEVIKESLRKKFQNYNPETKNMPFHYRLLGRDRMALFSFIHSLNTTFGTSIFEPVAETLASKNFSEAKKQYVLGTNISEKAQLEIQHIINELTTGKDPDKTTEIERIRNVATIGKMNKLKTVKVDLFLRDRTGHVHLFDIKTAKPNISNFKDFKRTLLEWIAIYLAENPEANVHSYIAIPYNPYEPKPYERWTLKGMLDLDQELKVADEFWDFLGGTGAYKELLNCFEKVGIELRSEIDKYFEKFK